MTYPSPTRLSVPRCQYSQLLHLQQVCIHKTILGLELQTQILPHLMHSLAPLGVQLLLVFHAVVDQNLGEAIISTPILGSYQIDFWIGAWDCPLDVLDNITHLEQILHGL